MSWFERSRKMERFAQQTPYRRVGAQDYIKLMRLVNKKPPGLPATDDMNRLLAKMISDLEDAVVSVYMNTVAAGHTSNGMQYPCPDCSSPISTFEELQEEWMDNNMLVHYWNVGEYLESDDYYGEDPEDLPDDVREAFEEVSTPYGGDGIFICQKCGLIKKPDDLDEYMHNPFPGGREILISDQIDLIVKHFSKIKESDTFERKFPYFEGIIEWIHGSGDISNWFIEGGSSTIDKYRNSKLPSSQYEEGHRGDWVHPRRRNNDWDWSKI